MLLYIRAHFVVKNIVKKRNVILSINLEKKTHIVSRKLYRILSNKTLFVREIRQSINRLLRVFIKFAFIFSFDIDRRIENLCIKNHLLCTRTVHQQLGTDVINRLRFCEI